MKRERRRWSLGRVTECAVCAGGAIFLGSTTHGGYTMETCNSAFEDISATGTLAPVASNSDDAGDVVPIGFTFRFFGTDHTVIGISSNGYLTFGSDLGDFSNDPIPTTNDPNDLIAPFWDDLNPAQGGTVHYHIVGAPGSRRFIVQWTGVPEAPAAGSNTFQAVLFEHDNSIEFRYGPFTADLSGADVTIGIENQDGTAGVAVDTSTVSPGDCKRFRPARDLIPENQKVFLNVYVKELSLVWNGDQGEFFRGKGEVFLSIWVHWPAQTEAENLRHIELGPFGGPDKFDSGTINNCGSRSVQIKPYMELAPGIALVGNKGKERKQWTADCPVAQNLVVDVLVWEADGSRLTDLTAAIDQALEDFVAKQTNQPVAAILRAIGLAALIGKLTGGADDQLGRCQGCLVPPTPMQLPDPCAGLFEYEPPPLDLENLAKARWLAVDAEDSNGIKFEDCELTPPANIGTLKLKITGGPLTGKPGSHSKVGEVVGGLTDLQAVNVGQPDEATILTGMELGAPLPPQPKVLPVSYTFYLDVDNDLATGAQNSPFIGGDFALQLAFEGPGDPVSRLLSYNEVTGEFEEVPGGVYDSSIDTNGAVIYLSAELALMGTPAGPIAGWGVVESNGSIVSVLPSNPEDLALGITPDYMYTGVPPIVALVDPPSEDVDVDLATTLKVQFDKAMDRPQTEAAFSILPSVVGSFSWQGNELCFSPTAPLDPMTLYQVTVAATATDRVGTPLDGNGDLTPGDSFQWEFRTEPLPLLASNALGEPQRGFTEGEAIFVSGSDLPSGDIDVYVVNHGNVDPINAGDPLIDQTNEGAMTMQAMGGELTGESVGTIALEGEYNVIADIDRNGIFDPSVDRIDRVAIGLFVLPDCNGNGVIDSLDIADGTSTDVTGDGIPDECQCLVDVTGDGFVNVLDLIDLLLCFGQAAIPPCDSADVNQDAVVNVLDLIDLLLAFGTACP